MSRNLSPDRDFSPRRVAETCHLVQPCSQSSSAISNVTSPVKLIGRIRVIALGSKPPLLSRIVRTGPGERLRLVSYNLMILVFINQWHPIYFKSRNQFFLFWPFLSRISRKQNFSFIFNFSFNNLHPWPFSGLPTHAWKQKRKNAEGHWTRVCTHRGWRYFHFSGRGDAGRFPFSVYSQVRKFFSDNLTRPYDENYRRICLPD